MVSSFVLMIVYLSLQKPIEPSYLAKTEIKSISTFDQFEYEIYNNNINNNVSTTIKIPVKGEETSFFINEIKSFDSSSFKKITKKYLLDLFIEKIDDNKYLTESMKEFGLIDKNNYDNDTEYESAVMKLGESLKLVKNNQESGDQSYFETDSWKIEFITNNQETWEKYLKFLDNKTNNIINKYLNDSFKDLTINQINIRKYQIEDIDLQIANSDNEERILLLKSNKEKLIEEKFLDRLILSFNATPIVSSKKFSAGNILYDATEFKNNFKERTSKKSMLILSVVLGSVFGVIYVLFSNAIARRG